jgi:hypothetical protein
MTFPVATWKTAAIAGASLSGLAFFLGILKSHGLSAYDADSPEVIPFIAVYFFVTMFVFVLGVNSFAPKELKTRIPMVYFPTNMEGARFVFTVWGRMLVWFLSAAVTAASFSLLGYALR